MRTILFVLALLGATAGRAQIFLDWYGSPAPTTTLLLDDYPNAAAAYSLRLLNSAYTGNCIEVRRASTNTNQNIGFVGGVLDTAALKTFCASTDCFVRTWYDQSSNARNAQMTIDANQPQIVAGGVVYRNNGFPALDFDGTNDHFSIASAYTGTTTQSDFAVMDRASGANGVSVGNATTTAFISASVRSDNRAYFRNSSGTAAQSVAVNESGFNLVTTTYASNTVNYYIDSTNSYSFTYTFSGSGNTYTGLGRYGGVYNAADLYEVITYSTDQSSNRTGIETNIDNFYNVY
jgi:hypothetical protein